MTERFPTAVEMVPLCEQTELKVSRILGETNPDFAALTRVLCQSIFVGNTRVLNHCYYYSKREETKKEHIVSVNKQFENAIS